MMPIPTRPGTSALGSPFSKCRRNSASGSISTVRHSSSGAPLSTMIVSCATKRLRLGSHVLPLGPIELQTYLREYHLSPRFQVTYTTAAESPRPSAHSLPPKGKVRARHFHRSTAIDR